MKYVVILIIGLLLHGGTALAQEEVGTVTEPTADGEAATQPPRRMEQSASASRRRGATGRVTSPSSRKSFSKSSPR
jgi:hypothetical protein